MTYLDKIKYRTGGNFDVQMPSNPTDQYFGGGGIDQSLTHQEKKLAMAVDKLEVAIMLANTNLLISLN